MRKIIVIILLFDPFYFRGFNHFKLKNIKLGKNKICKIIDFL